MDEVTPVPRDAAPQEDEGRIIRCLDRGFVRLVDVMGDDLAIVQAARVSYGHGTKSMRADRGLIHYLLKHRHTTPFEMVEFKFHAKMPIFVARQWIRHRTANVNEISGRYSIMEEAFWTPTPEEMRTQDTRNRQGSTATPIDPAAGAALATRYRADQTALYTHYQEALKAGVAREVARVNLPLSLYTEWYWKIDLHNLLHFLKLRMDAHAQKEIRVFAEAMAIFVRRQCPIAWEAFEEYHLQSTEFSRAECAAIREVLARHQLVGEICRARHAALAADGASEKTVERECAELRRKLGG
ncbi:MAG: FAD-dependent thymidylate synthase [Deltaproteobacteria bacterium]|nr:FAD-dependent thymidylate synthase [Deltaproteobacteria bacterium]